MSKVRIVPGEKCSEEPNFVCNQRYTKLTFVPLVLINQFKFFFNVYFFLICLSQVFTVYSVSPLISNIFPWAVVLMFTLLKEGIDDFKRYKRDSEYNSETFCVIRKKQKQKTDNSEESQFQMQNTENIEFLEVVSNTNSSASQSPEENFSNKQNNLKNCDLKDDHLAEETKSHVAILHKKSSQEKKSNKFHFENAENMCRTSDKTYLNSDQSVKNDIKKDKTSHESNQRNDDVGYFYALNRFLAQKNLCLEFVPSSELKVGDVVYLNKNQRVPADCVLLQSLENDLFLRTDQLDGETDWKLRIPCLQGVAKPPSCPSKSEKTKRISKISQKNIILSSHKGYNPLHNANTSKFNSERIQNSDLFKQNQAISDGNIDQSTNENQRNLSSSSNPQDLTKVELSYLKSIMDENISIKTPLSARSDSCKKEKALDDPQRVNPPHVRFFARILGLIRFLFGRKVNIVNKRSISQGLDEFSDIKMVFYDSIQVTVEEPHKDIYNFMGRIVLGNTLPNTSSSDSSTDTHKSLKGSQTSENDTSCSFRKNSEGFLSSKEEKMNHQKQVVKNEKQAHFDGENEQNVIKYSCKSNSSISNALEPSSKKLLSLMKSRKSLEMDSSFYKKNEGGSGCSSPENSCLIEKVGSGIKGEFDIVQGQKKDAHEYFDDHSVSKKSFNQDILCTESHSDSLTEVKVDILQLKEKSEIDNNENDIALQPGKFKIDENDIDIADRQSPVKIYPLSLDNTLWMNTVLASGHCICLVTYTGKNTKAQLNTLRPRSKTALIDLELNTYSKLLFVLCLIVSMIFTILRGLTKRSDATFIKFLVILSSVVPISLKVSIDWARNIYMNILNRTITVRNSNIFEDLGRIEYLLCDKTGTLTTNQMILRKLHLGNICFEDDFDDLKAMIHKNSVNREIVPLLNISGASKVNNLEIYSNIKGKTALYTSATNSQGVQKLEANSQQCNFTSKNDRDSKNLPKTLHDAMSIESITNPSSLTILDVAPQDRNQSNINRNFQISESQNSTSNFFDQKHLTRINSIPTAQKDFNCANNTNTVDYTSKYHKKMTKKIYDLLLALSVCHNVTPIKENGIESFQASSPDEIAIIDWLKKIGIKLIGRTQNEVVIEFESSFETDFSTETQNVNNSFSSKSRSGLRTSNSNSVSQSKRMNTNASSKMDFEEILSGKQDHPNEYRTHESFRSNTYADEGNIETIQEMTYNTHVNMEFYEKDQESVSNRHIKNEFHKNNQELNSPKKILEDQKDEKNHKILYSQTSKVNSDHTLNTSIDLRPKTMKIRILHMFPFSSESKRMGVIIKHNNKYEYIIKGADSVIAPFLKKNDWLKEETSNFAREGLRTLVICKKEIKNYRHFEKKFVVANSSLKNRKLRTQEVLSELEYDMTLLGLTGVEDRLQDGVKSTLERLRSAGIKIWMLTGDKLETAINVAISSKLFGKIKNYRVVEGIDSEEKAKEILAIMKSCKEDPQSLNRGKRKFIKKKEQAIDFVKDSEEKLQGRVGTQIEKKTIVKSSQIEEKQAKNVDRHVKMNSQPTKFPEGLIKDNSNIYVPTFYEHSTIHKGYLGKTNYLSPEVDLQNNNTKKLQQEKDTNRHTLANSGFQTLPLHTIKHDNNLIPLSKNKFYESESGSGLAEKSIIESQNLWNERLTTLPENKANQDSKFFNSSFSDYESQISAKKNHGPNSENDFQHPKNVDGISSSSSGGFHDLPTENQSEKSKKKSRKTRKKGKKDILDVWESQSQFNMPKCDYSYLVMDGVSLDFLLREYPDDLISYCAQLDAIVFCRCSPQNKSTIVAHLRKICTRRVAAIGDGGNDVAMITNADIGIGIVGKEGKQASLAADFSINRFEQINSLILWHGRNCYKSTARLAHLIIHRGTIVAVMQAIFCSLFQFSPINLFQGKIIVGYVTLYTCLPVFCSILAKDSTKETVLKYPELYKDLNLKKELSFKTFAIWNVISVYQGALIMLLSFLLLETELFGIITITFSSLILNELLMVILTVRRICGKMLVSLILSLFFYLLSFILMPDQLVMPQKVWKFVGKVVLINLISIIFTLVEKIYSAYKPSSARKLAIK